MWRHPAWAKDESEEYWDKTGKVVAAVRPFGDVWKATKVIGLYDSGLLTEYVGVYLTKPLAQKAIEELVW